MVCIYCGSKTQVINSRHQRRANQTWRRRECTNCQAIFTTEEQANLSEHWLIEQKNGKFQPYNRDILFLSLYESVKHRKKAVKEASELTNTVTNKLSNAITDGKVSTESISQICLVVLNRFDKAAATSYEAFH